MNWLDLIKEIVQICIIPILGVLSKFIIQGIINYSNNLKDKTNLELKKKYIDLLTTTIYDCVTATNQTYVNSLKQENAFDLDAQKHAFELTYSSVMSILSDDVKAILSEVYGDLNLIITSKIEAEVSACKEVAKW